MRSGYVYRSEGMETMLKLCGREESLEREVLRRYSSSRIHAPARRYVFTSLPQKRGCGEYSQEEVRGYSSTF